jgi:hypothetical protein
VTLTCSAMPAGTPSPATRFRQAHRIRWVTPASHVSLGILTVRRPSLAGSATWAAPSGPVATLISALGDERLHRGPVAGKGDRAFAGLGEHCLTWNEIQAFAAAGEVHGPAHGKHHTRP